MVPGGAAADRGVQAGDALIAINGKSMLQKSHNSVVATLSSSAAVLTLTLAPLEAAVAAAAAAALGVQGVSRSAPDLSSPKAGCDGNGRININSSSSRTTTTTTTSTQPTSAGASLAVGMGNTSCVGAVSPSSQPAEETSPAASTTGLAAATSPAAAAFAATAVPPPQCSPTAAASASRDTAAAMRGSVSPPRASVSPPRANASPCARAHREAATALPEGAYSVKWTTLFGMPVAVVCTSMLTVPEPRPLLALFNVLLLRNVVTLPPNAASVTHQHLEAMLLEVLMEKGGSSAAETSMALCLEHFPKMKSSTILDRMFAGPTAFTPASKEAGVFAAFDVRLCHGWLPDPHDEAAAMLQTMSQSELERAQGRGGFQDKLVTKWHDATAKSQFTNHGLCEVHAAFNDKEVGVLFRKNKHCTILKYSGELHVLLTEAGRFNSAALWKRLDSVDCTEEVLLDCNFHRVSLVRNL